MSQNFCQWPAEETTALALVRRRERAARAFGDWVKFALANPLEQRKPRMNDNAYRRPVPHIQHTVELDAAAAAVMAAQTKRPQLAENLRDFNPYAVFDVRRAVGQVCVWREDPSFYLEGEPTGTELEAVEFLVSVATLLREHLRAGNVT